MHALSKFTESRKKSELVKYSSQDQHDGVLQKLTTLLNDTYYSSFLLSVLCGP